MTESAPTTTLETPWLKNAVTAVYVIVICVLSVEIAVRIFFAIQIGPRTLLYGTEWHRNVSVSEEMQRVERTQKDEVFKQNMSEHVSAEARPDSVELHLNQNDGYTKFYPREEKTTRDVDTGERIDVSINQQGFRGPDFAIEKAEGVRRILTLGASSTFGFYDRDDETYPYYLQQILNAQCQQAQFEVINFGIPHATSGSALALLKAEGLNLDPDVVTFYQGRNDSEALPQLHHSSVLHKGYSVLVHRSLLAAFLDQILIGDRESLESASFNLEARTEKIVENYLGNLDEMVRTSRQAGFHFIAANQQATSAAPYPRQEVDRLPLRGVSYGQEVMAVNRKMDDGAAVTSFEYSFLIHAAMMESLEAWAAAEGVTFVDVIQAMDNDRHHLLSWVHLSAGGNRIVAEALAVPILREFCPG